MRIFLYFFLLLFLQSCNNAKNLMYLQDEFQPNPQLNTHFQLVIKKNDLLEINILTANQEANDLFSPKYDMKTSSISYNSGVAAKGGYVVDQNGEIVLPYIGTINCENKTIKELELLIENKLSEYLVSPLVKIQLINFKITVLGDVKNPGTFQVPNEKITIFQALGIAGDLNLSASRKIKLIREKNEIYTDTILDLASKKLFSSEFYFLNQNDLIYVPPGPSKINYSNFRQLMLPVLSGVSIIVSTLSLIFKL